MRKRNLTINIDLINIKTIAKLFYWKNNDLQVMHNNMNVISLPWIL